MRLKWVLLTTMITIELTAIALILANVGFSYKGFQEVSFRNRYNFHIDPILIGKEYIRMLSQVFTERSRSALRRTNHQKIRVIAGLRRVLHRSSVRT